MEIVGIVGGLVALGVAAHFYGQDSRDRDPVGAWHTWRQAKGGNGMVDPIGVEVEARHRMDSLLASAAQEQLLSKPARPPRSLPVPSHREAAAWLGTHLVRAGRRLQSYGRQPAAA